MSKKSNINIDHYKTKGRGRQGETVVHEDYKRSLAQNITSDKGLVISYRKHNEHSGNERARSSRLERIKRSRKRRGLSPRELLERKLSQRTVVNPDRQTGMTSARPALPAEQGS